MFYLTQIHRMLLLAALVLSTGILVGQQAPLDPFGSDSSYYQGLRDFNYFDQRGGFQNRPGNQPAVSIDDSRAPGTVVYVKKDMYEYIREWMMDGQQQVPLTQALLQQFDSAEVNQFNLNFQNGDSTYFLSSGSNGRGGGGPRNPAGGCTCKYLTFSNEAPQSAVVDVVPEQPTALQPYSKKNLGGPGGIGIGGGGWHKSERRAFGAGRADYSHLFTYGQKNKHAMVQSNDLDARVAMRLMYACVDRNELPSDCGCTKDVEIQGDFWGDLYASADGFGARRDVWASSEAWAILAEYTVGGDFESLSFPDVDRAIASAENRVEWNEEYFTTISEAVDIFLTDADDILSDPEVISDAIDFLYNLFSGEGPTNETGNGMQQDNLDLYVDAIVQIEPGEEKVWLMSSITTLRNRSKTKYIPGSSGHSVAAFSSTYNLHLTVPDDDSDPNCCMERYGMWAYGGYNMTFEGLGFPYSQHTVNFNDNVTQGDLSAMKSTLNNQFVGPWDDFDGDTYFGSTTSPILDCGCSVKPDFSIANYACDNVAIDISNTTFADWHTLVIWEVEGPQGQQWLGNQATGGFPSWSTNIIDLSASNSPIANNGAPYNFQAGKWYKLTLGVRGFCTDWTSQTKIFQVTPSAEIEFVVKNESCDDVTIELTNTADADLFFFAVGEIDDQNNWVSGTYRSTHGNSAANANGWLSSLSSTTINFADVNSSPLGVGAYPFFEAGKRYLIQAAVKNGCSPWVDAYAIVEIEYDAIPAFELDVNCNQVTFDGSASTGVNTFEISIQEITEFGIPVNGTLTTIQGQGAIGSYNLFNNYTFTSGERYRITLSVEGASCPGSQEISEDFNYSYEPMPIIDAEPEICVDDEYFINIGNSAGIEEIQIEIFQSDQFGLPLGSSTFITGGPTQWVTPPSPIIQIHPNPYLFNAGAYYTIRLFGRNACTNTVEVDEHIVDVISRQDCEVKLVEDDPCKADFDINPVFNSTTGGVEINLIGKSEADYLTMTRTWTFGDGSSETGHNSPRHTYTRGGNYSITLEISDVTGCRDQKTKSVSIPTRTLRRLGQDMSAFSLAPNPSNGRVVLNYSLEQNAQFRLLDMTGKLLYTQPLNAVDKATHIHVLDLAAGVYFGEIIQDGASLFTQKIFIQK